jgi:hypothetical protein
MYAVFETLQHVILFTQKKENKFYPRYKTFSRVSFLEPSTEMYFIQNTFTALIVNI